MKDPFTEGPDEHQESQTVDESMTLPVTPISYPQTDFLRVFVVQLLGTLSATRRISIADNYFFLFRGPNSTLLRARFLMRMGVPVKSKALRIWFSRNRS